MDNVRHVKDPRRADLAMRYVPAYLNDGYKGVLLHPIPLLEIFLFFEIWHFLIKSSDFGDWAHQGGFLC